MKTLIFGHRGASGYAPENTLEAFDLAIQQGVQGIELDVHLTADDVLVVAHDETINRVSNGEGFIRSKTLKELKGLRFNRLFPEYKDAAIPTLEEVFRLIEPSRLSINIELKNSYIDYPDLERKTIDLAEKTGMLDRVIFSSFNHHSMLRIKQMDPHFYCGLLYEATLVRPWEYAAKLGMNALHPHFSEVLFTKEECEKAHELGIELNVWTVNREEDIRACLAAGVDRIITNYPALALQCL